LLDFTTAEILRCHENGRAEGTLECGGLTPPSPLGLYALGTLRRRQAAALQGASRILTHGGEPQDHEVFAQNDSLGAFFRSLCTHTGRPLGTGEFVEKLERHTQRRLAAQKGGRKPNSKTRQEEATLQN
jgi:hypothetical protein